MWMPQRLPSRLHPSQGRLCGGTAVQVGKRTRSDRDSGIANKYLCLCQLKRRTFKACDEMLANPELMHIHEKQIDKWCEDGVRYDRHGTFILIQVCEEHSDDGIRYGRHRRVNSCFD